jgi:hypothetical protein
MTMKTLYVLVSITTLLMMLITKTVSVMVLLNIMLY